MVRSSSRMNTGAAEWVCVRVTDMSGVDLRKYRFDYDLTWAALGRGAGESARSSQRDL